VLAKILHQHNTKTVKILPYHAWQARIWLKKKYNVLKKQPTGFKNFFLC